MINSSTTERVSSYPVVFGERRPEFLRDELLHEFLERSASDHPHRVALRCAEERITYAELWRRSMTAARWLGSRGVGPGARVVLSVPRGVEMYVAMVAILKAGGTYVPADPEWPMERVEFMARDCGARGILADTEFAANLRAECEAWRLEEMRQCGEPVAANPPGNAPTAAMAGGLPGAGTRPEDCAYIIYTSGSTGRPKGVMVSHRSICHFVRSEGAVLGLTPADVVFQGSSLAFDMSLEEIWPAWAAGATLLVGTREMLRAGGDLATWLAREQVTAWTGVPTLVAMQEYRIPTLRLLNFGGEACPPDLVRAWARPGLRILNTYGPTEAAITATYAELAPGRPVTIGNPLPNYTAHIIPFAGDDEPKDGRGELWIGGPGVAIGYVGRPELTAERFRLDPCPGAGLPAGRRLYRTGDRVRLDAQGEIEFLGRIDTQVKIRGFRVELGEIESALLEADGLKQAAVAMHRDDTGTDLLVAYVVPRPGHACDHLMLRTRLKERLPAYMVPEIFAELPSLPTLTSGKVDRTRLLRPTGPLRPARTVVPPETSAEKAVQAEFTGLFAPAEVSIDDDFFLDLGGHSVRAAALVSALRKDPLFRHVSMADVYDHPTVRRLARQLDSTRPAVTASRPSTFAAIHGWRYGLCAAAQAAGLIAVYGLFSLQWLIPYLAYAWLYDSEGFSRPTAIIVSLSLFLVAIPVMLVFGIAAKWVVLGRLRPGEYPLWGMTYYRWWLTQRLLDTVPVNYLGRSPMLGLYYRLLGARIGHGVLLDDVPIDAPDCVAIGDDTGFGSGATLACCQVEDGKLKVGGITIGRNCYIGASSVVAMNTAMADGAVLEDLSMLPAGLRVGADEQWGGSPARRTATGLQRTPRRAGALRRRAFGAAYAVLLLVFPLFAVLPLFPGMMLMTELDQNTDAYGFMLLSPALAVCFVLTMCLQIAALKWLLLGRVKPARVPLFSGAYLRHWLVDQLMELSLDVANSLYATLYLNPWYRLLGVKLGPRAEVSTASSIAYDLLEVGEESFIADAVSLGAPRIDRGELILKPTKAGRRTFVGNSAVIPAGTTLGDGVLVGVLSVPPTDPAAALEPESSWFGTPAVFLPQRQVTTKFGETSTFRPTRTLVAQRLAIEFCRVILPMTVMIALTSLLMSYLVDLDDAGWSLGAVALLFPILYVAYAFCAGAFIVLLKWCVIGRYRAVEKPLWNPFVWRSELVTSAYENLAVPLFAEHLRGTPFLPAYLRLLGCRIGKRVYLDTTDVTEFDLVRIGDESALNRDCGPQTHLFEDRVMKIASVDIGRRCVIGVGSIVLYDTRMEDGSTLAELSMLMKGETLPAGTSWHGSPARPCG